jgi:hypothetical protein
MERTLILHIGHSKTGTTTLQKLVFPKLERYALFCKNDTPASAQVEQAFMGSPEIWRAAGERIFATLRSEMTGKSATSALISAEGISAHKIFKMPQSAPNRHRRDPFLLAAHLEEFGSAATRAGFETLKVIMGIRRQDQYLASRYVTNGWLCARPPYQNDFESQTLEIIDSNRRYFIDGVWLDYKLTHDLMAEIVQEKNVLVLPVEQLENDPARYFSVLSAFFGEPLDGFGAERKNVRRVAPDIWQIEVNAIGKAAREERLGGIRSLLARDGAIVLSPELKARILSVYRRSNQALAAQLDLDLAQYGYFDPPAAKSR